MSVAQATVTTPPEELSPKEIGKVQKHCRFAISALDYEDLATARKELRAALEMLGVRGRALGSVEAPRSGSTAARRPAARWPRVAVLALLASLLEPQCVSRHAYEPPKAWA